MIASAQQSAPTLAPPFPAADTGYDVIGPALHGYLLRLHAYIQYFENSGTSFLFCARGGVRIKRLYDLCASASGWPQPSCAELLWVSRMMACKAVYARAPEAAAQCLIREFKYGSTADVARAVLRNQPALLAAIDFSAPALAAHSTAFRDWLHSGDAPALAALDYLTSCGEKFDAYFKGLTRNRHHAALIDTGWQGTTQSLLNRGYPDMRWSGLYAGRILMGGQTPGDVDSMIGVLFEKDAYDPEIPESALVLHRHLFETVFESNGPSIEEPYEEGGAGGAQAAANLKELVHPALDALFIGAQRYIEDNAGGLGVAEIFARQSVAMRELQRMILTPSAQEAQALVCKDRSSDFGRASKVPVLAAPVDADAWDSAERRVKTALWTQGQIALEYPAAKAREMQLRSVQPADGTDWFDPRAVRASAQSADSLPENALPLVAVITRTKDRPLLLKRAAQSVASQTYPHYLWVVVNDGGEEEAARAVVQNAAIDPRKIVFISNPVSVGMEAASNIGVRAVQSDYIVIHDDDDSWEPAFLERAAAKLHASPADRYGGVITHSTFISEEIRRGDVMEHGRWPYKDWVRNVPLSEMVCDNMYPPIAFLFRRSVYEEVGGFDEDLPVLGDWHFNIAFLMRADIAVIQEPLANYHHRDRGPAGAYSNSVVGGISKHEEFNSIMRNSFLRKGGEHNAYAGLMMAIGFLTQEVRNQSDRMRKQMETLLTGAGQPQGGGRERQQGETPAQFQAAALMDTADLRWTLMQALHHQPIWRKIALVASKNAPHMNMEWNDLTLSIIRNRLRIKAPGDFDDNRYLSENRDVAPLVEKGAFASGYEHYVKYGRKERRFRPSKT